MSKIKNTDSFRETIWLKAFFDENTRLPLWVLSDIVIDAKNLKIEWFIVQMSLFWNNSKVVKPSAISRWSGDLFVSESAIKPLDYYDSVKKILIEQNSILRKKVLSESGENIWKVYDFIFSTASFSCLSIVVRKNFFGLFFYWKERIISKKHILDINKDAIIVKDKILAKAV